MPKEPWLEQKYAMNRARLEALGYIDKDGQWLIDPCPQQISNNVSYVEANTGLCCSKHG